MVNLRSANLAFFWCLCKSQRNANTAPHVQWKAKDLFGENSESDCVDKTFDCAWWSVMGDCESSASYMRMRCKPACRWCVGDNESRSRALYGNLEHRFVQVDARSNVGRATERSFDPRIYAFDDFLSESECDFLREFADPLMQPSWVMDDHAHTGRADRVRTNSQMYVNKTDCREHPIISKIILRMHTLARMPLGNGEQLQIGRYQAGQLYEPHFDSALSLARAATVLVYLAEPQEGGETIFPKHKGCSGADFLACCRQGNSMEHGGISILPHKGRAILFYSYDLDGRHNAFSLHGACPVVSGEKWVAQQWFQSKPFSDSPHSLKQMASHDFPLPNNI